MGWLRKTFLYRDDYIPALQGLKGLAVLWFFHFSFYSQFDPAKMARITEGKPWMAAVLRLAQLAVAPGETAFVIMALISAYLLVRQDFGRPDPGRRSRDAFGRIYGLYLLVALPVLSYTQPGPADVFRALAFLDAPDGFPPYAGFLGIVLVCKLLVFTGSALVPSRGAASPPTTFSIPGARVLSHPLLRYFGAVALPFFLIHTTWGFRLSRSILQGEIHSVGAIAAHYAMSLCFSAVFAGFLHIFFERPRFLRNAPSADKTPSSATQGVFP